MPGEQAKKRSFAGVEGCAIHDRNVLRRILSALLAVTLLICPVARPWAAAASAPGEARPAAPATSSAEPTSWLASRELLAQGIGALAGLGLYSLYIAPQAGLLEGRILATSFAGLGAVGGTVAYDFWTDQPIDYGYVWHRSGFVLGIAAGIAVFGAVGYPAGTGATWLSWAGNRAALAATGLAGAWYVDRWYAAEPAAPRP